MTRMIKLRLDFEPIRGIGKKRIQRHSGDVPHAGFKTARTADLKPHAHFVVEATFEAGSRLRTAFRIKATCRDFG